MTNYFDFDIDPRLKEKLSQRNINTPSSVQKAVIPRILAAENIIFSSQTGSGKTFAYLLPALTTLLKEAAQTNAAPRIKMIVIAPTLELCAQIKNEADYLLSGNSANLNTALVIGSGNIDRQIETVKKTKPALVVGNTARLLQLLRLKKLKLNDAGYVVLDEADRLVSRELFDETKELLRFINPLAVHIACSATLNENTKKVLAELFGKDIAIEEISENEILQNNISHWAIWSEEREKIKTLRSFLSAARPKKALVFAENANLINAVVSQLQHHKYAVAGIYSGVDKKARKNALDAFRDGKIPALVSSDVASRGLDIDNISHVITLGINPDSDVYIHRAGRTARAGKKGIMVSIGNETELRALQKIEKKLRITVYPKILADGGIWTPEETE
jgi:superfamily II DNA/RNA helicase